MAKRAFAWSLLLAVFIPIVGSAIDPPATPILVHPTPDSIVATRRPVLVWQSAPDPDPGDTVRYDFQIGIDSDLTLSATFDELADTSVELPFMLDVSSRYWWQVTSRDQNGLSSASPVASFQTYLPADLDISKSVTSADIIVMVNYVFKGATLSVHPCAANVNYDTVVNSADVIGLVNHVFKGGDAPQATCPDEVSPDSTWLPHDGDIQIHLYEPYRTTPDGSQAALTYRLLTSTIYPCTNYELLIALDSMDHVLNHQIGGIHIPNVCLTFPWYANWDTVLTLATGTYELEYSHSFYRDHWQLIITDSSLQFVPIDSQFTSSWVGLSWRRPYKSMSYACGVPTEVAWLCDAFMDSLSAHLILEEFQFPDSGQVPYPLGDGHSGYSPPARYFTFPNESDYDTAVAILDAFEQSVISTLENQPSIHIWLHSWDGRFERVP